MQAPLFFGLIAAFATSISLIAVATRGDWSERHSGVFALVAGGMLVTLSLLHIAPEAFALTKYAPIFMLVGYLSGLLLSAIVKTFFPTAEDAETEGTKAEAFTPIMAVAAHSFIDGVLYSVTFAASFTSGVFTSLSLILHEFPEAVIAFAILRRHGFSNKRAFMYAFLAAAITTPLGVIVSAPFMYGLGPDIIGALFAISAGLLLYVATGPLMAPLQDEPPVRSLLSLLGGVAVALVVVFLPVPGGHSHNPGTGLDAIAPVEAGDSHGHDID